jgi:trans-aconitate 2-methyltransferase
MSNSIDGVPGMGWDPGQYRRFVGARLRPARDLLDRVQVTAPQRIVDLGCGTGDVTRILAERWPAAEVIGIDASPEMLAAAQETASRIVWQHGDAATWRANTPVDLIYCNAVLHWLPDHHRLLPRLLASLTPDGVLAVQMPLSWDLPSHRLMREMLATGGPAGRPLGSAQLRARLARPPVARPDAYYALLAPRSRTIDIWQTEYLHILNGEDAVLEWVQGAGLRPVLDDLDPESRGRFLTTYRERLAAAYPRRPDGTVRYPFPRLFIVVAV